MKPRKKTPPTEPIIISAVSFTPTAKRTLERLCQDASDQIGWAVSGSAMLRALISYAAQQPHSWVSSALYPFVEQEIAQGRVWGSKKRQRTPPVSY
jgi:hypothetical protein